MEISACKSKFEKTLLICKRCKVSIDRSCLEVHLKFSRVFMIKLTFSYSNVNVPRIVDSVKGAAQELIIDTLKYELYAVLYMYNYINESTRYCSVVKKGNEWYMFDEDQVHCIKLASKDANVEVSDKKVSYYDDDDKLNKDWVYFYRKAIKQ